MINKGVVLRFQLWFAASNVKSTPDCPGGAVNYLFRHGTAFKSLQTAEDGK